MNKKYELIAGKTITVFGKKLFRIRALVDIGYDVEAGDEGGYIENEKNLSHGGDAWVYGNAQVFGNAQVYGNAQVFGNALVYGNAQVYGDAQVFGNAQVYGNAQVFGNALVFGNAQVYGDAQVFGNAQVDHEYKIMTISNMGSIQRTTTFFACKDGKIRVCCGCFFGDLDEFRAKVKETHRNTKHEQAYLAAADFVESVLDTKVEEDDCHAGRG